MEVNTKDYVLALNNGYNMPLIGLGTYQLKEEKDIEQVIPAAIDAGYRHIDTAFTYGNEHLIGEALHKLFQDGKIDRKDLFITSKLPPNGMQPQAVQEFFQKSLESLRLEYIDLYLIQFPVATKRQKDDMDYFPKKDKVLDADETVNLDETWKEMENLVVKGLIRSIGLANFNSKQVRRIYSSALIKPAVLQIECHAYLPQYELKEFCDSMNIVVTACSPLGSPYNVKVEDLNDEESEIEENIPLLEDPMLMPLSEDNSKGKTPAQILLRYLAQRKIAVIPKTCSVERLKENIDIFDFVIEPNHLEVLKSMARNMRYQTYDSMKGMLRQKEYPFNIPF